MRKIGIIFQAVPGLSDEEFAEEMAKQGFQTTFTGVYDRERHEKLAKLFKKYGIECETLHAPFNHINDMWLDCEAGEQMLAELKTSVDYCAIVNASIVVVHLSSGYTPPPITDIGRARYAELVEYATQKNVKVAFENQRKASYLAWALETFEDNPMVGFCWDCGHEACCMNGREFMPFYGKQLLCTHIHDNCGENGADDHLLPFDGVVNFERFAEHIQKSGFQGSFMLESHNSIHKYDDWTAKEFLVQAAQRVKKLVEMTDGVAI